MGDDYLQWNIRGLKDEVGRKGKVDKVLHLIENPSKIKILNIQETHLKF